MKKTGLEFESYFFQLVKDSSLASVVNGKVYREDYRPANSNKEDIIVIFMTAVFNDYVQVGKVNINVYVPDIISSGIKRKDLKRCREIERACQDFFDGLKGNTYRFRLGQVINTFKEQEIDQHFVNLQIEFDYNSLSNN